MNIYDWLVDTKAALDNKTEHYSVLISKERLESILEYINACESKISNIEKFVEDYVEDRYIDELEQQMTILTWGFDKDDLLRKIRG